MLAVQYRRPVVAFVDSRDQIPGLPLAVPVLHDLAEVQAFVVTCVEQSR